MLTSLATLNVDVVKSPGDVEESWVSKGTLRLVTSLERAGLNYHLR